MNCCPRMCNHSGIFLVGRLPTRPQLHQIFLVLILPFPTFTPLRSRPRQTQTVTNQGLHYFSILTPPHICATVRLDGGTYDNARVGVLGGLLGGEGPSSVSCEESFDIRASPSTQPPLYVSHPFVCMRVRLTVLPPAPFSSVFLLISNIHNFPSDPPIES